MKQLFQRLKARRKRQRKDKDIVPLRTAQTERSDHNSTNTPAQRGEEAPVPFVSFSAAQLEDQQSPATYHDGDDNSDGYHRYDKKDDAESEASNHPDEVVRIALHASQKALPVATKNTKPNSSCELLDKRAGECFEKGNIDDAVNKYEDALLLKRQTLLGQYNALKLSGASDEEKSKILASMATSINNLAYLRQVKGEASAAETLESYEIALSIKQEILGSKHLSVGKTLNNIGSVHYIQRNFYAAAENYEEARDILRAHLGEESLDVSTVTSNLGDVHYCLKQWKRASEEYRAALGLRWKILGAKDPKVVRLMELVAEVEIKMSDLGNAEVEECSSDQGTFAAEVDQLQTDLDLDIEFFDSLEKEAPMTLIRDKAEVFKELRALSSGHSPDARRDETSGHCHAEEERCSLSCDDRPVSVQSQESSAKRYDDRHLKVQSPDPSQTSTPNCVSPQSPPKCESPQSDTASKSSLPIAVGVQVLRHDVTPRVTIPSPRTPRSRKLRETPSTASSTASPATPQHFTPVERKEALNSVRQKLARIRQEKEKKQPVTPVQLDAKQLKAMTTSNSKLLKASELLTIQQGLNSLRESRNDSTPSDEVNARGPRNGRIRGSQEPTPAYFLRP